jgi:hypothetical protein
MERVLLGAGPHESYIIMCSCGAIEVTREPRKWRRFKPYRNSVRCYCEECGEINSMEVLEDNFDGSGRQAVLQALDASPSTVMTPPELINRDNVILAFPLAGCDADMPD